MTPERWRQIEELYHLAREHATADRAALLAQADPELRREVEAMLAQDASGKILDQPADDLLTDSRLTMVAAGSQLGPFRIEVLLGAGGMGEVYRAVDTRLDRKVAIKISTEPFSARFEREARAISALNHPHICTLYDVGPNYLVMELVEGETLAAKLKKGRLSIDDTLLYGGQIAAALAEAHSKGITHRDLKPGNIMIAKSGVKVLDFGLAKSACDKTLTGSNAVMGSPAYMAPEQSEGKECDARTDIYALGLVLREMATGRRDGATSDLPPPVAHVIGRCLANDPDERWQAASDVRSELAWAATSPAKRSPAPLTRSPALLGWIAAGVLVLALGIAVWAWLRTSPAEPPSITRWTAIVPTPPGASSFAVSRDGTRVAYAEQTGISTRIWVRVLDRPEEKPIPGTEGGLRPFFSPDGQGLAYFTGNGEPLKKVPVTGGTPITLCDSAGLFGGSWGEDDSIIFSGNNGLMRVSASGGKCESLTRSDPQKRELHRWPQILPGGQAILFTIGEPGSYDSARIAVLDLKSSGIRVLLNGGSAGRYVPSGHLVYVRGGTMFAVPFDGKRLAVTGAETPVIEGVFYNSGSGFADYAFSDSGLLVYMAARAVTPGGILEWLDRKGVAQTLPAPPHPYTGVRLSPDGQRVAMAIGTGARSDVWIYELARRLDATDLCGHQRRSRVDAGRPPRGVRPRP